MSTRQYIGARYVPKFVGTYDPTQAYDALDVVDNGSGTTYIARIQTPPNTPLTDTTHWLVYGSSSGAILDLQGRVSAIETDIPVIKSSILSIGGQVDTNTGNISALDNKVNHIKDRHFILMGDSFGYGVINSGVFASEGWIKYASDRINAIPGCDCIYLTAEQASIAGNNGFGSTYPYSTQFNDIMTANPNYDFSKVTDIVVLGGTNDIGAIANVPTGFSNFMNIVGINCPKARIRVGLLGVRAWTLKNTVEPVYRSECLARGANYSNLLNNLICDPTYYTESGHITAGGYNKYNPYVLQYILYDNASYDFTIASPLTVNANYDAAAHTITAYFEVNEKDVKISVLDVGNNRYSSAMLAMSNFITSDRDRYTFATGNMPETVADQAGFSDVRFYFKGASDQYHFYPLSEGRMYKAGNDIVINTGYVYPAMSPVIADHNNTQFLTWSI